jgi:hypothetical protein
MMSQKENFKIWFRDVIESLYEYEHGGFALLMLTFPLLERYLRSKSGTPEDKNLGEDFYRELVKLFPVLKDNDCAKKFWQVYRNGILHQATLSEQDKKGTHMPDGWLFGGAKDVEIDSQNAFWVNPVKFAQRVIDIIEHDFSTFEAESIRAPGLAKVQMMYSGSFGTSGSGVKM